MGFRSPAADYQESRLNWNELMVPRPAATMVIPRVGGFALIDNRPTI